MIISKSNVSPIATITATPDSSLQEVKVLTDGDYSSIFTDTLNNQVVFTFDFAVTQKIDYIAIGGSNISTKDRITISSDGVTFVDDTLGLDKAKVIMYRPKIEQTSKIEITIFGNGGISIAEVSMGEEYEVPMGEQGGYSRPWTVPNIKTRSALGLDSSPISLTYESRASKSQLVIQNNIMKNFNEFKDMLYYISSNTFYILEDDNKFHSYACFNADIKETTVNSQTRALGRSVISYSTYSEASETFL